MPDSPDQIIYKLQQENKRLKNILKQKDKKLEQKDKKLEQENKSLKNILKQKDKKLEQKDKKLEQENKSLKNILKQKDKKLEQKDRELGLERGLWKSRDDGWNPGKGPALHLLEVLDDIIRDGDKLRHATLADGEQFRYMLERAKVFLTHSGQMPLFCDNASRASDPGNRCKLHLRHALLMALMHKKENITQGTLAAFFGIDQSTVSRYFPVMDAMLAGILPTADNISEEVAAAPTREDFKKIVPGSDGGEIFIDGTHCPIQRPSVKSVRRMKYSGKKKNVYQQYQRVHQPERGGDRHIKKHRRVSRRHHAAQGTPHAVWKVGEGDARSGPARIRQVPPIRRPRLPGNRRPPARHHAGDPAQEDQGHAADAGAKKAQPQDQLHPGVGGAHDRQAQALRAPHRPVRRQRSRVQQGVQRDHRAGKPESFVGLHDRKVARHQAGLQWKTCT